MSVNDVERVKQDLDVMKQVVGLEPTFGWHDVWQSIVVGCLGIALAWMPYFAYGKQMFVLVLFGSIIISVAKLRNDRRRNVSTRKPTMILPLVAIALGVFLAYRFFSSGRRWLVVLPLTGGMCFFVTIVILARYFRKEPVRDPRRKSQRIAEDCVIAILLIGYLVWSVKLDWPEEVRHGAVLLIVGGIVALQSLSGFGNFQGVGFAISMMVCGILIPIFKIEPSIMLGAAWAIAGFATGGVMAYQLWSSGEKNVTD